MRRLVPWSSRSIENKKKKLFKMKKFLLPAWHNCSCRALLHLISYIPRTVFGAVNDNNVEFKNIQVTLYQSIDASLSPTFHSFCWLTMALFAIQMIVCWDENYTCRVTSWELGKRVWSVKTFVLKSFQLMRFHHQTSWEMLY